MKKFLTFVAGFILVCIALAAIGPVISLGIGAAIAYYSVKSFVKSPSVLGKLWWGIVGVIGLSILFNSLPALIGVAAVVLLYYGYKQWKTEKTHKAPSNDSDYTTDFSNFEREWEDIMSKHK